MTTCYIHTAASHDTLVRELKELIPDPAARRRMSRVVRMGVSTALEALGKLPGGEQVSAIVTATGLGCLADSEKFLRNVVENDETLLNPTPFIQSTFNTVGAQVALLSGNHGYNMTYVHGGHSFEDALLDAMIQAGETPEHHVLLGAFDEATPTLQRLEERMGLFRDGNTAGEGAYFFVLSEKPLPGSLARIRLPEFPTGRMNEAEILSQYAVPSGKTEIIRNDFTGGLFHTLSARALWKGIDLLKECGRVVVYNDYYDSGPAVMILECV